MRISTVTSKTDDLHLDFLFTRKSSTPIENLSPPNMLQFLLHAVEIGVSGYALYHASIAIPNLQKYESKSKKAAKYLDTAARELHRTRTTQTAGTVAV
jgi:hypothetical protein